MPTDEGKQVLKLLAEGKIDTEQAYRLLRALGTLTMARRRHRRPRRHVRVSPEAAAAASFASA